MASVTSPRETSATFHASARALGALNVVASLAVTLVLADAITDLAHGRVVRGLWLLAVVLLVRTTLSLALAQWSFRVGDSIRDHWRRVLPDHFAQPRGEGEGGRGDLADAIEKASVAPSLDLLATSARIGVLGLALVYWAAGWLSLSITIVLLLASVPLYQKTGRRSEAMALEYQQRRLLLENRQLELLHHTPELRGLGAVGFGSNEIAAISDSEHTIALRAIRVALESSLITEFLSGVSIGLVAMVVGFGLLGGRLSLDRALIAVLVTSEVFSHVRRYGAEFHRRENALKSVATLHATPRALSVPISHDVLDASGVVTRASATVVSLRVAPGDRVLVTGASGSGKTTLLHTFLGWLTPLRGSLERTALPIGYVSVNSALMSGSLRENLALGVDVPDQAILDCLESIGLSDERFRDLDTELLADGRGISTGEKVRLVLARALLAQPALVLLDDIAGTLDQLTRRQVHDYLESWTNLSIIEATVDTPILTHVTQRVEVT